MRMSWWKSLGIHSLCVLMILPPGVLSASTGGEPEIPDKFTQRRKGKGARAAARAAGLEALAIGGPQFDPFIELGNREPVQAPTPGGQPGIHGRTTYVTSYCSKAVANFAALAPMARVMNPKRGRAVRDMTNRFHVTNTDDELSLPDIVPLNEQDVMAVQEVMDRLFVMLYGKGFERVSPPQPVGPSGEMKILLSALRHRWPQGKEMGIASRIRRLVEAERVKSAATVRVLEEEIELRADQFESENKGTTYRPEPVIQVASAIHRVQSGSGMAGTNGFVSPFLNLIENALKDYLNVMTLQAELDRVQVQILTFLTRWAMTPSSSRDGRTAYLGAGNLRMAIEGLLVACLRDGVTSVPEDAADALYALTAEDETELTHGQKAILARCLIDLFDWENRLEQSRADFGRHYESALMAFFLVVGIGRTDGNRAIELSSFLRDPWVNDLEQHYKAWVLLGTNLLNHRLVDHSFTDSLIELHRLGPEEVVSRYLRDVNMHQFVLSQFIRPAFLQREYDTFSAEAARRYQVEGLRSRISAFSLARTERRVTGAARRSGDRFLKAAENSVPGPLLASLKDLLTEEEAKDAKAAGPKYEPIKGRVRNLPAQLPHYLRAVGLRRDGFTVPAAVENGPEVAPRGAMVLGDFYKFLQERNREAASLIEDDIEFQRQFVSPDRQVQLGAELYERRKELGAKMVTLAQEMNALQMALENALLAEDVAAAGAGEKPSKARQQLQAQADASATIAHYLVKLAPTLARVVVHDNSLPALRGLQRRIVSEVIQGMLDNPEELAGELDGVDRAGRPLGGIKNERRRLIWKIIASGAVLAGTTAGGLYFWYHSGTDSGTKPTDQSVPPVQTAPLDPSQVPVVPVPTDGN